MTVAVELQITDVAFGGKGVARTDGKAVFVPYVIDGESVSASITREHKKFLEAELEAILTASPHRVEPRCPYFGRCGGCVYQHMVRTSAGAEMEAGEGNAPAYRWIRRTADAAIYRFADRI